MKLTCMLAVTLAAVFTLGAKAQFVNHHLVSIEGGLTSMATDIPDGDFIRGYVPIDEWESNNNVTSIQFSQFGGLKYEYLTMHDKLGFSTGARFSRRYGIIGRTDEWDDSDFFYLRYREDGQNTEYFTINNITQTTDYLGIPLEIRLFPYRANFIRFYFRAGVELNYKLKSNTTVEFSNVGMDQYEDEVKTLFNEPGKFNANGYFTTGLRVGKNHRPTVNVEAMLPVWNMNSSSEGMLKSYAGVGVMVNLQVPINSHQIETASESRRIAAEQERVARENAKREKKAQAIKEKEEKAQKALEEKEDIMLDMEIEQKEAKPLEKQDIEKRKEELINSDNEE